MVEIKTFVEVANNVNKVEGGGGCTYSITYKYGFCWISASLFSRVVRACSHDPGTTHCPGATH